MVTDAKVNLWGKTIGAVSWLKNDRIAVFQYTPEFITSNIQIAPLMMPLREAPYSFPALDHETFRGLPGLLADSLPDRFGNTLIDAWLGSQGRALEDFNPVERLCCIGNRGMGALEFEPAIKKFLTGSAIPDIAELVEVAQRILENKSRLSGTFIGKDDQKAIGDIIRVGTSAGGARAKAILAWNPETGEFRSGQLKTAKGFEYWIMKLDGVSDNYSGLPEESPGYGKIEYVYHLTAKDAGIEMTDCRLHKEGGRSHFMTRRFDRTENGGKLHLQTLGGIAHFDFRKPAVYSYEMVFRILKQLKTEVTDFEQLFLRAVFNVVGRNNDDHVKNISFLMDKIGNWKLAQAYDLTYSWNPYGMWTSRHQMSINGKWENVTRDDLITLAEKADIKKKKAEQYIENVLKAFGKWRILARDNEIDEERTAYIEKNLITDL